jgi:hypothetical protein
MSGPAEKNSQFFGTHCSILADKFVSICAIRFLGKHSSICHFWKPYSPYSSRSCSVSKLCCSDLVSFANTTSAPSAVLDSHVHGKLGQEDKVGPRISFWGGNVGWGGPGKLVGEGTQYATTTGHFDATEPVVEAEV